MAVQRIVSSPRWVTEGIHTGWTDPLCAHADLIVWLDNVPTRTRLLHVLRRFVAGGVAESRRQRGVRRFVRPASYRRHLRELARATGEIRAYERSSAAFDRDAGSRAATAAHLAPFKDKVVHCRSRRDIDGIVAMIASAGDGAGRSVPVAKTE